MKCHIVCKDSRFIEALEYFKTFFNMPYQWHEFAEALQVDPKQSDIVVIVNEQPEKMDGIMTIQKIRSLAKLAATPVIFLTESLSEEANIVFRDFDFVWPSELPFQSSHFFHTLNDVNKFYQVNHQLIEQIQAIHFHMDANEFREAFLLLQKIKDKYPSKFRKHLLFGKLYLEARKYPHALKQTQEAIKISPKSLEAHTLLASIYHKMGNTEEYQKLMNSITQMAEILLKNLIHWGNLFLEKGRSEKSITAFEAALEKDPENLIAKHGLLAGHLIEGRTSIIESKNFADYQSLELARLFNLKGIAMAESGNFAAAERLYQNSLKILPYQNLEHKLWMNLGLCMKKKGNLDRAKDYFEKSQNTAPQDYQRAEAQLDSIDNQIKLQELQQNNFADNLRSQHSGSTLNYREIRGRKRKI
ncbi:MAG: tetratricopeptide repeat protein [Oligoflexus sp.]